MQRIGVHLSFWQTNWDDDLLPFFKLAKSAGFEGVEIPLLEPHLLDLPRLRDELQSCNLLATCGTGLSPERDISHADRRIRAAGFNHLRTCLEAASKLGSPVLGGVTYAAWGSRPQELVSDQRARCIKSLREIGPVAEDNGVVLCLEVLNRFEGHLINTVEQGLDLLDEIDSPSVYLHLDTFHLNIEEADVPAAIRSAGERLRHFHASENNRRRPGCGHIPWQDVKHALDQIDYQGWIVMESFVQPKGEVGQTLSIWRHPADDLDEEARQGASFLRKVFLN